MTLDNPDLCDATSTAQVTIDTVVDTIETQTDDLEGHIPDIGAQIIGRAVTATLRVSANGDGTDGLTWATAYTTIQAALDAASTDGDDCTLIMISPHTTNYDINTTGDPTWAANVILAGTHRNWAKIKNTHASATSIMKLTGKAAVINLNFNLGAGSGNGLIMTHGGFRVSNCQFVGEDLTGAATALHLDGASTIKHGKVRECDFLGEGTTHMTGILADNCARSEFECLAIHNCKTAVQVVGATSDTSIFCDIDIGDCGIGFDLDAGNEQHIVDVIFHHNTTNIDDEVGDHIYSSLYGQFEITIEPDNFAGVTVTAHNTADTWGADTELRAAATSTKPFRIVAIHLEPGVSQWYRVRFSADSGSTFFDDVLLDATKREGASAPAGTEFIFNAGTRISASAKAETGGEDTIAVWLELQVI